MKAMLEEMVKNLVDDPASVKVNEVVSPEGITLEINVAESDLGKVIGKEGKIAGALRTVMSAAGARENKQVFVEIVS